jgi:flagellar biosynthesis/type III secretory pathway protein FliH
LLKEAERESEELALAVIERVVNYKLRQDDSVFKAALEQVLEVAQGCREALLLVADENFSEIWQQRTEWKQLLPGVKAFSVETDARLAPGDLVLETNQGTIDARVDTIIGQVAAEFSLEGQA